MREIERERERERERDMHRKGERKKERVFASDRNKEVETQTDRQQTDG